MKNYHSKLNVSFRVFFDNSVLYGAYQNDERGYSKHVYECAHSSLTLIFKKRILLSSILFYSIKISDLPLSISLSMSFFLLRKFTGHFSMQIFLCWDWLRDSPIENGCSRFCDMSNYNMMLSTIIFHQSLNVLVPYGFGTICAQKSSPNIFLRMVYIWMKFKKSAST